MLCLIPFSPFLQIVVYNEYRARFYSLKQLESQSVRDFSKKLEKLYKKMKSMQPLGSRRYNKQTLPIILVMGLFHTSVKKRMSVWLKKINRLAPDRLNLSFAVNMAESVQEKYHKGILY